MAKFRKRPVVIEAWLYPHHIHRSYGFPPGVLQYRDGGQRAVVQTLEGEMTINDGDWLIRGIRGEYYPCKPDIFTATYCPHEEDEDE